MARPKTKRIAAAGQTAPGSRLPRRYKKNGKETGNFFIRIAGHDVNLRTKDAAISLVRTKEAKKGVRAWIQDDGDGAGAPVPGSVAGTEAAKSAAVVEPPAPAVSGLPSGGPDAHPQALPPTHTAPAALPPVAGTSAAGTPGGREGVKPDEYIPPTSSWAQSLTAAVAETEGAKANGEARGPDLGDGESDPLEDVEFVRGLVEQGAMLAVEAQIFAQEWLLKRGAIPGHKIKAAQVPAENKGREVGKKLWTKEIKKWIPEDAGILPEWLQAIVMTAAYTLPAQLGEGAEEIVPGTKPEAPRPPAPPSSPVEVSPS